MARSISAASIAKLAQTHGAEPVMMVDIAWAIGGTPTRYASKDVSATSASTGLPVTIPGKIMELGAFDSVVAISLNETSEEFTLILDDTDGSIKSIVDTNDIMLRDVWVYQWFEGLDFEDRFLVFQGKINSPISWSETDRTTKFSVVSQLEDKDVGFSPDEGQFPDLPDDMVGKLWPECFGTSLHQKAIQVDNKFSGTLGEPVGLRDFTLPYTMTAHGRIRDYLVGLGILYATAAGFAGILGLDQAEEQLEDKANGFFGQVGEKNAAISEVSETYNAQIDTEVDRFRVIGGEHFPRGSLKLLINDAIFTGGFIGPIDEEGSDIFKITCADHPEWKNYEQNSTPCGNPGSGPDYRKKFPAAEGFFASDAGGTLFVPTGTIVGEQAGAFFAQGGASVTIYSAEPLRYFVSITPGRVLKVAAFTTFQSGERVLVDVPTNLYNVYVQNYGGVSVTVVQVTDALSKQSPSWEDTIYVTFQSAVGPNPIDIMTYLINKYADIGFDGPSFNGCRAALNNYPMHFCLNKKKNIVTVLKELAFMSRTAVSIKNGKFFCRYLPAEPPSVFTFSEDNVLTKSIELNFTDTEDLVTKYVAAWRGHGAQDEDNQVVIRYNVKKYGTHQEDIDFYAYNYISAVVKTLTFWINRRGHTWKKLSFKAALDALNVETFDGVTLDFQGGYASNGPTLGYAEEGSYNPNDNTMEFTIWTGVRAGDMTQYDLAYPQKVSTFLSFPDPVAEAAGFAGGDGPGNTASGNISRVNNLQGNASVEWKDDDPYSDGSRRKQDKGSKKPSDIGDKNPGAPESNAAGQATTGSAPLASPEIVQGSVADPGGTFWIDIRTTEIADSDNAGNTATLDSFFYEVTDNTLKAKTDATWKNSEDEGEFDFKWSSEDNKFGAGIAFLKDD